MKFFRANDFTNHYHSKTQEECAEYCADIANKRLEQCGKDVYSVYKSPHIWQLSPQDAKHRALLINIEDLEPCTHPEEKVRPRVVGLKEQICAEHIIKDVYICECGAKLKPKSFEVVE